MYKKCKVVILPTDKKARLMIDKHRELQSTPHYCRTKIFHAQMKTPQHLYILSDDEIKEGDWYIVLPEDSVRQCSMKFDTHRDFKKIIASTDFSLTSKGVYPYNPNVDYNIPSIPKSFIDKYVSEYNKGNKIEEVMVEYEGYDNLNSMNDFSILGIQLKLNSDNTISIKSIKDSWTREEVIDLCERAWQGALNKYNEPLPSPGFTMWLKTNL